MFCYTFPAEIAPALRAYGNRLTIMMVETALVSKDFHVSISTALIYPVLSGFQQAGYTEEIESLYDIFDFLIKNTPAMPAKKENAIETI